MRSLAITSDNKYIVSISYSNDKIKLFSLSEKRLEATLEGHTKSVLAIGLSVNDKYIISYSRDTTIRLWSVETKNQESVVRTLPYQEYRCVAISNDNIYCNLGTNKNNLDIYNCIERKNKILFKGHTRSVASIVLTSDYKHIITGSHYKTVRIWNFQNKAEIALFKFHENLVQCVGITHDNKYIMSCSVDTLRIWAYEDRSQRAIMRIGELCMKSMAVTKNIRYIVASIIKNKKEGEYTYTWKIPSKELSRLFGRRVY